MVNCICQYRNMPFENSWNIGQIPSIATLSTDNSFTELLLYIICTEGHLAVIISLKTHTVNSENSGADNPI